MSMGNDDSWNKIGSISYHTARVQNHGMVLNTDGKSLVLELPRMSYNVSISFGLCICNTERKNEFKVKWSWLPADNHWRLNGIDVKMYDGKGNHVVPDYSLAKTR